jgi:hypothetical protein
MPPLPPRKIDLHWRVDWQGRLARQQIAQRRRLQEQEYHTDSVGTGISKVCCEDERVESSN